MLRQRHFELDLGELFGGLAQLAQEGEPTRVGMDPVEEGIRDDLGEAEIFIFNGLVQPLEGLVRVAPKRVDEGDTVGSILLAVSAALRVALRAA